MISKQSNNAVQRKLQTHKEASLNGHVAQLIG